MLQCVHDFLNFKTTLLPVNKQVEDNLADPFQSGQMAFSSQSNHKSTKGAEGYLALLEVCG